MSSSPGYDAAAVAAIAAQPIPVGAKGWPPEAEGLPSNGVAQFKWRVLDGDLPLPALVVRDAALKHNLALMRDYCEGVGALLAPHGKTTMTPQLFARQLDAGAWGLTAATPAHLRVYRHVGVKRILLANQLVEPEVIRWVSSELDSDPDLEFFCLVDSLAGIGLLERELEAAGAERPMSVLVELGIEGARSGCRSVTELIEVAREVARAPRLRLAGVEGFEGMVDDLGRVDAFLEQLDAGYAALESQGLFDSASEPFVSAGGSAFFDRVAERFRGRRLVLRGGCYLTHDQGIYARDSPLDGRAGGADPRLANAIETWSAVLSRPEPGLAITSMGKRDSAFDYTMPKPAFAARLGAGEPRALNGQVLELSDQHAHLRIEPDDELAVGDLVGCTISHPCTALDKWRLVAIVDEDYVVLEALHTFF